MTPETAKAIIAEYEERRKRREQRKLAKALARELEAAVRGEQGPKQPRAYWRWPMGIGAHAIALCVLAAAAALGYWLTH
jgi:hypothetical protein